MKNPSEAEFIMSDKLRRRVKFQINSAKHIATEFIMSNKLRCASPPVRLLRINLLCEQKSSKIIRKNRVVCSSADPKILAFGNRSSGNFEPILDCFINLPEDRFLPK